MQRRSATTRLAWTMGLCSLLVGAGAGANTPSVRRTHAGIVTAATSPLEGVLRFLAPEPHPRSASRRHKIMHVAWARKTVKRSSHLVAFAHVRLAVAPRSPRAPDPPRSIPLYPGPPFPYGPPRSFAGYDPRDAPAPYIYQYGYPYPDYVYVMPWPRWPAGY